MTKNTMGTKLPRKLVQKMSIVGEQIELARLRRNLSVAQIAERAACSLLAISRIEKSAPTVAIGIYLQALYTLQLGDDILWLAKEDKLGEALQDLSLKTRRQTLKKVQMRMFFHNISCLLFWWDKKHGFRLCVMLQKHYVCIT